MADHSKRTRLIRALALWLVICFVVAAVGAAASVRAETFYVGLVRPGWAPPGGVFGPVWTLLYTLMAIAAALIWIERPARAARFGLAFFTVQLLLNALWSWLFFAWYQGAWAFVDIVLLWLTIAATLVLFWRVRALAGVLLVPYLAWVSFAAALNYAIWQSNPAILS